jgi:NADP-dependent 3-hydroxy acid dehydrogenase YdfG
MSGPLDGIVALVTGASSGIGEATARRLAAEGAAVSLVARRRDRLEELASSIRSEKGSALVIQADVTDQAQAIDAVERTVAELGRLDILVNNAGVMLLGPVQGAPTEEWDRMIALNLQALLYVSHAALPHLLHFAEREPRRVTDIVNVSSAAGRMVRNGSAVYALTKWGVGAFSESLRMEVLARHVRVSLVEPGATNTELRDHLRPEIQAAARSRTEGVELLEAEDIADAIAYIVTRDRRVAINEVLLRPTEQEG